MNSKFKQDYYRMTGREYCFGIKEIVDKAVYHNIRFMYWYRSYERKPSLMKKLILLRYARKYGLEISVEAKIGEGAYLGHPYNITVGGGGSDWQECKSP